MNETSYDLNPIAAVFITHQADFHIDEITRGHLAFVLCCGLLLYMQAVYAELHRIEIGGRGPRASTLYGAGMCTTLRNGAESITSRR